MELEQMDSTDALLAVHAFSCCRMPPSESAAAPRQAREPRDFHSDSVE